VRPSSLLQVLQQVDDLRLDRDVERRDRLVADDELGLDGERAGDADALALAAGELVRAAAHVVGGAGRRVSSSSTTRACDVGARRCRRAVDDSGSPTMSPTVMRGLSEANGSWKTIWMRAAQRAQRVAVERGDVAALEAGRSPAVGSMQAQDAAADGGLAAAGSRRRGRAVSPGGDVED
jgi:hypothetical protein